MASVDPDRTRQESARIRAYTFGYNRSVFAERARDAAVTMAFLNADKPGTLKAFLALDGTGPIAAVALSVYRCVRGGAISTGGFRFASVTDLHDVNFLPAAPNMVTSRCAGDGGAVQALPARRRRPAA